MQVKSIQRFKNEKYVKLSIATALLGLSTDAMKKFVKAGGVRTYPKNSIPKEDHPQDGICRNSACKVFFKVSELLEIIGPEVVSRGRD